MRHIKYLESLGACTEAIEYAKQFKSLKEAWENCKRGDWMLWLLQKRGVSLRKLTLAKAVCAKLALHLMKDQRSKDAVAVAERFGLGLATKKELDDAYATAIAATDVDAYAAYATAIAAADVDAYAADVAAAAADATAYPYTTFKECAIEIRKVMNL